MSQSIKSRLNENQPLRNKKGWKSDTKKEYNCQDKTHERESWGWVWGCCNPNGMHNDQKLIILVLRAAQQKMLLLSRSHTGCMYEAPKYYFFFISIIRTITSMHKHNSFLFEGSQGSQGNWPYLIVHNRLYLAVLDLSWFYLVYNNCSLHACPTLTEI